MAFNPSIDPVPRYLARDFGLGRWLGIVLLVALFALFTGLVAASGSVRFALILGGAVGGMFLLFVSNGVLLLLLTVLSFYVVGQIFYFGGIGQALWLPYGIGLLFYGKWIAAKFVNSQERHLDAITLLIVVFLICTAFSTLLNLPDPVQAVATGKNYVAMWGVFFILAAGLVSLSAIHGMWRLLWWALFFQVPIVVYQYLVVAPSRQGFGGVIGGVVWDAVVGGFGGHREGGGASGSMGYFACLMFVYALARYRRGAASLGTVLLAASAALVSVALAEVKVVVVLLPLAILALLAPQLFRRPILFISSVVLVTGLGFALLGAYQSIHYKNLPSVDSPAAVLERAFGYSLDPNRINMRSGEMGRVAAVYHWVKEAPRSGPAHVFFGHGAGSSRSQSLAGPGHVALRYPFKIDRSSAVQILWDIGIVGFLALFAAFSLGVWRAAVLAKRFHSTPRVAAYFDTCSVGLVMLAAMLFYGRDPFDVPALALLMAAMLGLVAWKWREAPARVQARVIVDVKPVPARLG